METDTERARGDRSLIPRANILEWGGNAPWPLPQQIEQDLIICRALCDIFGNPFLAERLAFRGGTAIHKLLFGSPLRYSEDIDLVQMKAEPIRPTIDVLRDVLSWLGRCRVNRAGHSAHLLFKFVPDAAPDSTLNLKVEINTREHESLFGVVKYPFKIANSWFSGATEIVAFDANELFGTKLRALLQREKNRDLFDLGEGYKRLGIDPEKVVACFEHYMGLSGDSITRAVAEERLLGKLDRNLTEDIQPLLPAGITFDRAAALDAFQNIWKTIVPRLRGKGWRLSEATISDIQKTIPGFLD